jgi:hypothetical protein
MSEGVYRVTEVIGVSSESWEDAVSFLWIWLWFVVMASLPGSFAGQENHL